MKYLPAAVIFALGATTFAHAAGAREAAHALKNVLTQTICGEIRPEDKTCSVTLESSTHNLLPENEALWAFSWSARTIFKKKGEKDNPMRDALEKKNVHVLDIFADHFTGIAYFRQKPAGFTQIGGSEFAMITMNPVNKAVARIMPDLLSAGEVHYELPVHWQLEGLKSSEEGEILLSFTAPETGLIVRLADLDDADLAGVTISSCLVSSARAAALPCTGAKPEILSGKPSTLRLKLQAARKIKSSQPAFKLLLQNTAGTKTLLQLAIPFRPSPNYFMFGVTGFLFGGLMAVMLLVMKRKNPPQKKA